MHFCSIEINKNLEEATIVTRGVQMYLGELNRYLETKLALALLLLRHKNY